MRDRDIILDFSLNLARKYMAFLFEHRFVDRSEITTLPEDWFTLHHHSLREYRDFLKEFKLKGTALTYEEKKLLFLLFGTSLYQKNGVYVWHIASFFHSDPRDAMQFISRVLSMKSPLIKNKLVLLEETDFSRVNLTLDELTNYYNNRKIYLSPVLLARIFEQSTGAEFQGVPTFRPQKSYKNVDQLLSDISDFMRYLFYLGNFYRVMGTAKMTYDEDIYNEGDFSLSIKAFQKALKASQLDIELVSFMNRVDLSPIEFVFLIYLVHKVVIAKEMIVNNIEELLTDLCFIPSQTRAILHSFSKDSLFVAEGIIDAADFFSPVKDPEEMEEFEEMMEREGFDFSPYDFNAISISKERIYRLIFTDGMTESGPVTQKLENQDSLADLDKSSNGKDKIRNMGLYEILIPRVTLKNVILDQAVEKDLLGAVDMTKTIDTMQKWGVKPTLSSKSFNSIKILFYGPSGTGKTITAEALAGQADAELFKVDASNLVTSWVGESAKNVKKVFKEFYKYSETSKKRVFMFFNEADQLLSARGAVVQAADKEYNQMQNILLEELENFDGVFLATTNLIDLFDTAWNRRFTIKIKFDIPTFSTRLKLWELHISDKLPLAPDVDIKKLAETELAGGQIANVVYNAARKAALRAGKKRMVTQKDFQEAIRAEKNAQLGGGTNKVGFSS